MGFESVVLKVTNITVHSFSLSVHPAAHAKPRRPLQTSTLAEFEELYWREFAQRQEAEKLVRRRMVSLATCAASVLLEAIGNVSVCG